jgi:FkbM family methyltransferase
MLAPLIARHWPFANGSGRIIDKYAKGFDLGHDERIAWTSDGFPMHVFADDHIGRHLLLTEKFDRSVAQILLNYAKRGDTLLDIGANIGYYSAVFLSKIEDSKSICYEPQPSVIDLLRKNMEQFGSRVQVMQMGLADQDGELRFAINEENRGASRFCPEGAIKAEVREAKKALGEIDRIDLLKMDVEGFEEPIFRNAESELARLRPRAIVFEDQTGAASQSGTIGAILTRLKYQVFGIDKRLFTTARVPVRSESDCRFNDYLAVSEEH